MNNFILLVIAATLVSCGKSKPAPTSAPAPAPAAAKKPVEKPAPSPATSPAVTAPTTAPAAPAAANTKKPGKLTDAKKPAVTTPKAVPAAKTRKEIGQRWGIKFHADQNCQVVDEDNATLFKFGVGKTVTLYQDGLMTAHDTAGKEWLHVTHVKELFVLRQNLGYLDDKGSFRYVWVGHQGLLEFANAKKLVVDNEGFLVYGATEKNTVLGAYRWDGVTIVNNFWDPTNFEFKADSLVVTDKNGKVHNYARTKVAPPRAKAK